jgi:hypothetical protein
MNPMSRRFARAPAAEPPSEVLERARPKAKRQRLVDFTNTDAEFDVQFMDCCAVEVTGGDTVTINRISHAV